MNPVKNFLSPALLLVMILAGGCGTEKEDFIDRMETEHQGDTPVENASAELPQQSEVKAETVTYATVGEEEVKGYLAMPEDAGKQTPGLIVIHEWWGLNDNIRMMARRLAGEGYKALAVDLYHGKVAESSDKAGKLARSVEEEPALDNLSQAYAYLVDKQGASGVGTIGWCFGGGWSLQTALAMPEKVDATVIYYGRLETDPSKLKKLEMPVLGFFGSEDSGIPPSTVKSFENALNEAGVENDIYIYEGANHAFANPSGSRYEKEAAEDAWNKTTAFFGKHLKE